MQFKVITKKSKETNDLLNILKTEWGDAFQWLTDVIDVWSQRGFPQIVVALNDGEVIGHYSLVSHELVKDDHGYTPWLGTLFVRKKYRGHNYGSILLGNACRRVKNMGYNNLFLATQHIQYYEKFDFKEIGLGIYNWGEPTKFYQKEL